MLRHLLFWLLPPITLYFPTYTYFRQFWVKSQRSITLNYSKTRAGPYLSFDADVENATSRRTTMILGASQVQKTGRNIITVYNEPFATILTESCINRANCNNFKPNMHCMCEPQLFQLKCA